MKAANTFFLPSIRATDGQSDYRDAVLEIIRSGAPVGAAGLLTLLKSPEPKNWSDEGPSCRLRLMLWKRALSIDFKNITHTD